MEDQKSVNVSNGLDTTLDVSMRINSNIKNKIISIAGQRQAKTGKRSHLSTIVRDYLKKGLEEGLLPIDEVEKE